MADSNKTLIKPSVLGGFSDRMGIKPINTEMQLTSLDGRSRIQLFNKLKWTASSVINFVYEEGVGSHKGYILRRF